jgi:hypothetical protein
MRQQIVRLALLICMLFLATKDALGSL